MGRSIEDHVGSSSIVAAASPEKGGGDVSVSNTTDVISIDPQRWRTIDDHEARWRFLEETCFFAHNLGVKKIKHYPWEQFGDQDRTGFTETKFLRKYFVSGAGAGKVVTHEGDPVFQQPIERFLQFLSSEEEDWLLVPFFVLPFPGNFMTLSLEDQDKGGIVTFDLEGNPEERRRQRVSDYSLPSSNQFLNDPISYNKTSAKDVTVSLPVKLNALTG